MQPGRSELSVERTPTREVQNCRAQADVRNEIAIGPWRTVPPPTQHMRTIATTTRRHTPRRRDGRARVVRHTLIFGTRSEDWVSHGNPGPIPASTPSHRIPASTPSHRIDSAVWRGRIARRCGRYWSLSTCRATSSSGMSTASISVGTELGRRVRISHQRLPRLPTDQTASVVAVPAESPTVVMLAIVRSMAAA